MTDSDEMQQRARQGIWASVAERRDPAVLSGDVKRHHDGRGRIKTARIHALKPFVHVDDIDVTPLRSRQGPREVEVNLGLPFRGGPRQ
jgi:hypothetical protein